MISCTELRFERDGNLVLFDCDLEVAAGQHLLLTGPSGAGKTTLLRLIAGLEAPNAGRIRLSDLTVSERGRCVVSAQQRGVGMVFQDHGLWPAMTVEQHLISVLRGRGLAASQRVTCVQSALQSCRLLGLEKRRPGDMSGGEQQRLALARCLITSPKWLLLDEPFAGLDIALKNEFSLLLSELRKGHELTTITVTHQPWDALSLGPDLIAVLEGGKIAEKFEPHGLGDGPPLSRTRALWIESIARNRGYFERRRGAWQCGRTAREMANNPANARKSQQKRLK